MLALLLLLSNIALAQNYCLLLEGLNIGCVPSVDHTCKRNKMVDNKNALCNYVGDPGTSYRVEGPIKWSCETAVTTTTETEVCDADGCKKVRVTTSTCTKYYPPLCNEECVPCFNQVVSAAIGHEKGCIVCTRAYCPDEPGAQTSCPSSNNGLPLGSGEKCTTPQRCPTSAVDPLGNTHPVTVTTGNCSPPQLPQPPPPTVLKDCPWKVDKRSGGTTTNPAGGCEPIDPDNQNP